MPGVARTVPGRGHCPPRAVCAALGIYVRMALAQVRWPEHTPHTKLHVFTLVIPSHPSASLILGGSVSSDQQAVCPSLKECLLCVVLGSD